MSAIFSFEIRHQKQNQKNKQTTTLITYISHVRETKSVNAQTNNLQTFGLLVLTAGQRRRLRFLSLHEHVVLIVVVKLLP